MDGKSSGRKKKSETEIMQEILEMMKKMNERIEVFEVSLKWLL